MAGNKIQYTFQMNADVSAAKKEIDALAKSLAKISNMNLESIVEDTGLNKASAAAQELQKHLQQAVNVNTGKLNLSAFNKSLQGSNTSLSQLTAGLLEAGSSGSQAFMQLASAISNAEIPMRKMNATLASWGQTLKNTVKWELSSTIVHGLESALSGAVSYAKGLNTSLTNIRIVTGQSVEDMARFATQANRAAKELSTTTKAYADASLIYYQQGDTQEQAAKKAAITIKAANSSFNTSAAEMSEYLTAVWNSYQVGADELERYVDIMAALGAKTATSLEEIATSMQKVAATANTVGVSMEQVSSIIATVSSVTRESAESIGTSYKTIFARIGDLKLGGVTEDGIGLGQVSSALESIGVEILDSSDNLREMGDIITDLGDKWQFMNEAQKTAIAQVVAGKRQYTQLMALFENWDMYKNNLNFAENSEGALQEMQDIYSEGWEAAATRVTAAMEKIYQTLIDDQAIVSMLKVIEKFVETLGGAIDGFGGLGGIIANVGGMLTNYFSADIAQGLTKTISGLKDHFKGFNQQQQEHLQLQIQYKNELDAMAKDSSVLSAAQNTEYTYLSQIADANIKLTQQAKNLTAEQVSEVQGLNAAYAQQMQQLVKLQQIQERREQSAKLELGALKQAATQDEIYGKAGGRDEYYKKDAQGRRDAIEKAQKSMITDFVTDVEIVIEPEVDGKAAKTQMIRSVNELQDLFKKVDWDPFKNLDIQTFDQLVNTTQTWTTSLAQASAVFSQMQVVGGDFGDKLFAADKTMDELVQDMQQYVKAYNDIAENVGMEALQINGQDGKTLLEQMLGDPSITREKIIQTFTQIQAQFAAFTSNTTLGVRALQDTLIALVPPELQARFRALFQEWAVIGAGSMRNLDKQAKKLGQTFENDVNNAIGKSSKKIQNLVDLAGGLESIVGIFNTIHGVWDTLKDPDTTAWEKFGSIISGVSSAMMGLRSILDAGKVIQAAYNALLAIGVGLEVADAAAKRDGAKAQKEKNAEVIKGITTGALENATKGMSGSKKALTALKGLGKVASKTGLALAGMAKTALVAAGPYIALAAAVAAVGVSIWAVVTAEERYKKALDERAKELTKARQENQEDIQKLTNDTASLDSIMKDTTLTYEEQIEQINAIAKAYGVQATAVDALTGSYSRFATQMIAVSKTEAEQNAEDATINRQSAQKIVDDYLSYGGLTPQAEMMDYGYYNNINSSSGYQTWEEYRDWVATEAPKKWYESGQYSGQYENYKEFYDNNYYTSAEDYYNSGILNGVTSTAQAARIWSNRDYGSGLLFSDLNISNKGGRSALITDLAWTKNNWTADGNLTGLDKGKIDYSEYLSAEGEVWNNADFQKALNDYGFEFDADSLAIRNLFGVKPDYVGLMTFLEEYGGLDEYIGTGGYTDSVIKILEDAHIGELRDAERQEREAKAIETLWNTDKFLANVYNPKAETADLETTRNLIEQISPNMVTNGALADVLSNYSAYEDSATILGSMYKMADSVVNAQLNFDFDPEEIKKDVVTTLIDTFPEIDVETILKLTPSDIEIKDGKVTIDEAVEKYVKASIEVNKQRGIQQTIDANRSLLTQDTFSEADYQKLLELEQNGALGEDFNAETFARQDAATREAEIERRREDANETELIALEEQISAAQKHEQIYKQDFYDWENKFNANNSHKDYAVIQSQIAEDTAVRDELQAAISKADSGEEVDWKTLGYDDLNAAKEALDEYNASIAENNILIEDGVELETAWRTAQSDWQRAQNDLDSSQYQQWADDVKKATKAANAFSSAIGDKNNVTKENLAIMQQYDENAVSNFQEKDSVEWSKYAYEQAIKYYDDLADLYKEDSIVYAMIQQEKAKITKNISDILLSQSQAELEIFNGRMEEVKKEAQKLEEKAKALESAIETGILTAEQTSLFDSTELTAWNNAANATERAAIAANMWSKSAAKLTDEAETTAQFYEDAANNNFSGSEIEILGLTNGDNLFGEDGYEHFKTMLGKYEKYGWFDPGEMAAWDTAYQSALSKGLLKGKKENIEVIETVRNELLSMSDDATEEGKRTAAAAVDMIKNIFASVAIEEQAAADVAVDAWEDAFNRIAELRKKILSGEDISGDIFGGGLDNLWQQFKDSGYKDYASFSADVKTGQYMPELPEFKLDKYFTSMGIDQFKNIQGSSDAFVFRENMLNKYSNEYRNQNSDATDDEVAEWAYEQVKEDVTTALTAFNGHDNIEYDVEDVVAAYMSGNWSKTFDFGNGVIMNASQIFNRAANTIADAGTQMDEDMKQYAQRQNALAGAQGKVTEVLENGDTTATINGKPVSQEELTKLDAALERAQAEGAKEDADWENLSSEDRALLSSYGVDSFDEVDGAAEQCASALAILSDVAYKIAETFLTSGEGGVKFEKNEKGEWGTYKDGVFWVDEETNSYMKKLDEARQGSNYHQEDVQTRTDNYKAQSYGFANSKDWQEATENIQNMAKTNDDLADSLATDAEAAREVAKEISRYNKSVEAVTSNYEEWNKTLKDTDIEKQRKAVKDLDRAYSDMLDLDYDVLPDSFLRSADNLDLMKKAAEGSQEAYDQLQSSAAEALYDQIEGIEGVPEEIQNTIDSIASIEGIDAGELIQVDDTIDTGSLAYQLTSLYNNAYDAAIAGGAAAAQAMEIANQMMNAVGFDAPEMEEKTITLTGDIPDGWTPQPNGTVTTVDADGNTTVVKGVKAIKSEGGTYTYQQTLLVPKGSGFKKSAERVGGRSSKNNKGGGGGGGGGSKPKKLDKKEPEDSKERYHKTNQTLDRLADELEKVDKLKTRAYGKNHLNAIKQEIGLLKQEIGLQQDYVKQAQDYLKIDRERVASLGATFNEDGIISNYDELIDSIVAKYNDFIDKYNASSASAQEGMEEEKEEMDKWFDKSMEWISQYEETLNIVRDKENEIIELQNEISAKTLEGIQYKVEIEVELNDAETEFLDYLNEKYSETLKKQGMLVENLIREQQLTQENLAALNTAKTELDEKYANGELTQADYIEGLKDINNQILDNLSALEELRKEIQEAYGNALDLVTEKIDNHTEKIENASSAMESYISIMGLLGQNVDYEKINEFYKQQYEYNLASLETQQQYLDTLKEEEAYYLAKMARGELTETEREQFEALQDTIASVQDEILSKTEETLSALKEAFSSMISGILKDFEESIAGAGNSLEDLASDYEYYLEVQERNVSTSKELYEISKLNRQIEQDIADASSSVYKQRLAALQEEIKAKSADRALTEYDIQMMNLEYELLQRQMALEEAKSAKDTVRLTRDSSGNYIYQYTANQDAINEAQQGVEDVLQRMAEANAERVGQLEQETINTYQNMVEQIEEIANSEVLTQEEKNARIAEIVARTQEKMNWIQQQYTIATENTTLTYERIQDQYGKNMADAAQMTKDSMNDTIGEIINKTNEFSLNMQNVQGAVAEQLKLLQSNMDAVLTTTKWDEAAESIKDYDAVIEDAQQDAQKMIATLGGENGLLTNIRTTTAAWDLQSKTIENLITYYEQLYKSILKIQETESTKTPATPVDIPTSSTPPGTDTETPPVATTNSVDEQVNTNQVQYQGGSWQFYTYDAASGGKKGAIFHGNNKSPIVTKEDESGNRIKISGVDGDGHSFVGRWISKVYKNKELWKAYAMGGLVDYTGPAWVDGTKDRPELMLNASDTENMLTAVQTVRSLDTATLTLLDDFIKLATSSMLSANSLHATGVHNANQELQQQVHITAEFPNVQDSNEIQDAFDNLINRAAQFVGSIKK